jgi:hypothetical protein
VKVTNRCRRLAVIVTVDRDRRAVGRLSESTDVRMRLAGGAAAAVAAAAGVSGFRPVEAVGAGAGRTGALLSFVSFAGVVLSPALRRARGARRVRILLRRVADGVFGELATGGRGPWLRSWLPTPYPPAKPIARPTVSASTSGHTAERARSSGVSAAGSCPGDQADRTGHRHLFDRHVTFGGDRLEVRRPRTGRPTGDRASLVLEDGKRLVFGNGVFSSILRNRQR